MTEWSWLNVTAIPLLVIVPILPTFGIFFFVSIIEFIISNKKLSKSGNITKAQIVQKYERGSITYYKKDAGKSWFIVCEFIIQNTKTNNYMLCQSKFMVDESIYNNKEAGDWMNIVYLPRKYRKYHNLQILNVNIINKNNIIKRVIFALLIIFLVPMIIAIFAKSWSIFVCLIVIGIWYYVTGYFSFLCCCPNKTWFKNKSFKQRKATDIDFKRFGIEINEEQKENDNATAKLLISNNDSSNNYSSINK